MSVITPPRSFTGNEGLPASDVEVIEDGDRVRCPAGEVSGGRGVRRARCPAGEVSGGRGVRRARCPAGEVSRKGTTKSDKANNVFYDFRVSLCAACPLVLACHPGFKPGSRRGRQVAKNEYEVEYQRAGQKSQTEVYREVRRQHPAVERKLNELARHQGGRRARYGGQAKGEVPAADDGFCGRREAIGASGACPERVDGFGNGLPLEDSRGGEGKTVPVMYFRNGPLRNAASVWPPADARCRTSPASPRRRGLGSGPAGRPRSGTPHRVAQTAPRPGRHRAIGGFWI